MVLGKGQESFKAWGKSLKETVCGGGQVVSMLAFFSGDLSLYTA